MAGVVVWEWQNEYGSWRPYSPNVTAFIESNSSSNVPLQLGSVDQALYLYSVDVSSMVQTRLGTGTQRHLRRRILPSSSPIAKGITWQWEGDSPGAWNDFDVDVAEYIDDNFVKNNMHVDLASSKFQQPYRLDLSQMTQTRYHTGRVRNIQRVFTSTSYPSVNSVVSCGSKRKIGASGSLMKRTRSSTALGNAASGGTGLTNFSHVAPPSLVSNSPAVSTPSLTQSVVNSLFGAGATFPGSHSIGNMAPASTASSQTSSFRQGPITRRQYHLANSTLPSNPQSPPSSSTGMPLGFMMQPNVIPLPSSAQHPGPNVPFPMFSGGMTGPGLPQAVGHSGLYGRNNFFGGLPSFGYPPTMPSTSTAGLPPGNLFTSTSQSSRVKPQSTSPSGPGPGFQKPTIPIKEQDRIKNFSKSAKKNSQYHRVTADEILSSYVTVMNSFPEDEDCCICCEKLAEASGHGNGTREDHIVLQLEKCSHVYHKLCLAAMYDSGHKDGSLQCPSCKTIYGEKMGICPQGEMEYHMVDTSVAGYEGYRTMQISYHIHNGTQGPEHPNPGTRYRCVGFPRVGFLPDCDKGRKILLLLIVAWKRRLTFTIGRSTTTNMDNCVTWNEIHHKTELYSNYSGHGYPDPNYLDNVLNELAVHGITEKDLPPLPQ